MKSLAQILQEAEEKKTAIGHFNISDLATLRAIAEAVTDIRTIEHYDVPAILIGTSEGERDFIDVHEAVSAVRDLRGKHDLTVFLNADHTHSLERVKEAAAAGYDAILFDGGKLPLEENIRQTKQAVEYVKSQPPRYPGAPAILVEGELGYIGSGSVILKAIPKGAAIEEKDLTKPEEAARFVKETGVDMLAPAVGNIHGMFKNAPNPKLNIKRIKEIKLAVGVPLVLHGGSGIGDEDFLSAIHAGISVIHINTEIRIAWREGLEAGFKSQPEEVAPYKLMAPALDEIKKVVYNRLILFNRLMAADK